MSPTITLPATGPAVTNYGILETIPRTDLAAGIWRAVNRYGEVRFTRYLKGARCSAPCAKARPDTWLTCSCACGGSNHGGTDHGVAFELDQETRTSTVVVTPANVDRITGLPRWDLRLAEGDRVEYTGEFRPSDDGDSDLATVMEARGDVVVIGWDYSGELEEVAARNLSKVGVAT